MNLLSRERWYMHYFLSRCADRLGIGTLNLPPVSSNAIRFGAVPMDGNQIMSCFVITRLQVNPPALNNRLGMRGNRDHSDVMEMGVHNLPSLVVVQRISIVGNIQTRKNSRQWTCKHIVERTTLVPPIPSKMSSTAPMLSTVQM